LDRVPRGDVMTMASDVIPDWAQAVLAVPGTDQALRRGDASLMDTQGHEIGCIADGVVRMGTRTDDPSIGYFHAIGGTRFFERAEARYAMSSLDTPVYHEHLRDFAPEARDAVIVDVGGGDGRNAMPWLAWGFRRVVVVDPVAASLVRLRGRLAEQNPEWLDRVLLIEADARRLPLRSGAADRVFAIEALCYLNEEYEIGLAECRRILATDGRLLVSDRDYEGGLLARLLYYGGVAGMLEHVSGRDIVDGLGEKRVRSRCFTRDELIETVERQDLKVVHVSGISAFSLMLSFLDSIGRLGENADARVAEVRTLLDRLGRSGSFMRSHVVVAERASQWGRKR
jgi:SAM-dependent methyltransferase